MHSQRFNRSHSLSNNHLIVFQITIKENSISRKPDILHGLFKIKIMFSNTSRNFWKFNSFREIQNYDFVCHLTRPWITYFHNQLVAQIEKKMSFFAWKWAWNIHRICVIKWWRTLLRIRELNVTDFYEFTWGKEKILYILSTLLTSERWKGKYIIYIFILFQELLKVCNKFHNKELASYYRSSLGKYLLFWDEHILYNSKQFSSGDLVSPNVELFLIKS